MATITRQGLYGFYNGSTFDSSASLTENQQRLNAIYISKFLLAHGWSRKAIAGLLGNMQAESSMNPGRWQSNDIGNYSGGYGLVQWTPVSKYTNWCYENGYNDPSEMDNNLNRILYELENNLQWIATSSYNFSFRSFSTSNNSPSYLAIAFLLNYERPADQSTSVQNFRGGLADNWYDYIKDMDFDDVEIIPPDEPDTPTTPVIRTKRKGFNFVLFNKHRRVNNG